jgi:nucleoside-diphosphate-sugar epimerase
MAPSRIGDVKKTLADMEKAKAGLGFEPSWPLDRGLKATLKWWREEARIERKTKL